MLSLFLSVLSSEIQLSFTRSLIPALKESGNYSDAAELALNCLNDLTLSVRMLCDGRLYPKALYIARMNQEQLIGKSQYITLRP